ncbi:hypothetical protein NDU88_005088 [Pleurodeles waltl]|uniref:Uncharacterized protein n=1 Tax=Pleurodeles waltl TaxID=8319 RepID=A0AAV7NR80_PLEWA|nr:hypothetical protein NDU88_005088 [Pleurodeles waltl]
MAAAIMAEFEEWQLPAHAIVHPGYGCFDVYFTHRNGKIMFGNKADVKRTKTRWGGKQWKQKQRTQKSRGAKTFQEELSSRESRDHLTDESKLVIVNLSDHPLKKEESDVLSKGLGFCPTQMNDPVDVFVDLFKFISLLKLKDNFNSLQVPAALQIKEVSESTQTEDALTPAHLVSDLYDLQLVMSLMDDELINIDDLRADLGIEENLYANSGFKSCSE